MRIFLIIILIFVGAAHCAATAYSLQPSDGNYSEESMKQAADKINKEKEKIMEDVISIREKRENNLRPFVEPAKKEQYSAFDYAAKENISTMLETKTQNIKTTGFNSRSKGGINYLFLSLILAAFLLSYFFIRPNSR